MPLFFAVGQHQALEAVKGQLSDGDQLLAYLDDTFIVTQPESTGDSFRSLETELWNRAKIRIHGGKTKIWNRAGIRPPICDELERRARAIDPSAIVWRGSEVPCHQQGLKVLGTPLGHPEFVRQFLEKVTPNTICCSVEFLRSMICRVLGSFCCIVWQHVPIFFCGL